MSNAVLCPLCQGGRSNYRFNAKGYPVLKCPDCALMFLHPQPDDAALTEIYSKDYFLGEDSEAGKKSVADMKRATAEIYLQDLLKFHKKSPKSVECAG